MSQHDAEHTDYLLLTNHEVHLWICDVAKITDTVLLQAYEATLDRREHTRMQRFLFEKDRHLFLVSHAMLRTVLSKYAAPAPSDWRFDTNTFGKPAIATGLNPDNIQFNLSHTNGIAVCAITLNDTVGVDVEQHARENKLLDIADRFFSKQETTELHTHPLTERKKRFFDYWTLKESYIKARGKGLSIPLDSFSFFLHDDQPIEMMLHHNGQHDPATDWFFWLLERNANETIAVCRYMTDTGEKPLLSIMETIPLYSHSNADYKIKYSSA